jgi:DNA-binding XRE family transcriptional regulator
LGRERPFEKVLSSPADFLKWRAFVTYSQSAGVAASLGLHRKTIEKWLVDKYGPVWELLQDASKQIDITYSEIADPYPDEQPGDKKIQQDRQGAIHQFARSQAWFFTDPVVRDRYSAP